MENCRETKSIRILRIKKLFPYLRFECWDENSRKKFILVINKVDILSLVNFGGMLLLWIVILAGVLQWLF